MKNILIGLMMLLIGTQAFGQILDHVTMRVEGLGCPFCAYGLEKKLMELESVQNFKIDLSTGKVDFEFPSLEHITLEEAKAQVVAAGYTPKAIQIERAGGEVEKMGDVSKSITPVSMKPIKIEFKVAGSCGMCKSRIEAAAMSVDGVSKAKWDAETQMISLKYDRMQATLTQIHEAIVAAGHDTEALVADSEKYESLPGCCHYR